MKAIIVADPDSKPSTHSSAQGDADTLKFSSIHSIHSHSNTTAAALSPSPATERTLHYLKLGLAAVKLQQEVDQMLVGVQMRQRTSPTTTRQDARVFSSLCLLPVDAQGLPLHPDCEELKQQRCQVVDFLWVHRLDFSGAAQLVRRILRTFDLAERLPQLVRRFGV